MFKKLAQRLRINNTKCNTAPVTRPFSEDFLAPKNKFLNTLSKKAVEMYEKQTDIKNFSKLVISNPENITHNNIVTELFDEGVVDPFVDDKLEMLYENSKFLKDLGLL